MLRLLVSRGVDPRRAVSAALIPTVVMMIPNLLPLLLLPLQLLPSGDASNMESLAPVLGGTLLAIPLTANVLVGRAVRSAVKRSRGAWGTGVAFVGWVCGWVPAILLSALVLLALRPFGVRILGPGQGGGILVGLIMVVGVVSSPISGIAAVFPRESGAGTPEGVGGEPDGDPGSPPGGTPPGEG